MTVVHPLVKALFEEADQAGWSLRAIEKASGVDRAATQHWRRRSAPTLWNFEAVANALGFDLVMVRRDGPSPRPPKWWENPAEMPPVPKRVKAYTGRTKLTQGQVDDIRTRRMRPVEFAKLYGISGPLVSMIQRGKRWPDPPDRA